MNSLVTKNKTTLAGFSLIELLVVMLIISVIIGAVTLVVNPVGSFAKQLNQNGERLFQQMNFARDEALVLNSIVALDFSRDDEGRLSGEVIWKRHNGFDPETNLPTFVEMGEPLSRFILPEDMGWEIVVDGSSVETELDRLLAADGENELPEIVFENSGDVSPFSLTIFPSEEEIQVQPDLRQQRFLIAVNERGELVRYAVGEEAQ